MQKLTCLYNADGEVVGYFSDYGVAMAARQEWDRWTDANVPNRHRRQYCRSHEVAIAPLELENVEPGDSDRVDFLKGLPTDVYLALELNVRVGKWLHRGATSIEVQRFLINKYRRPEQSNRDSDLGGPVDAAGVLYVLRIKAPK